MPEKTYVQKAEHRIFTAFGMDLRSIREGFSGGHFDAESTAAEFRAACTEAGRRLSAIESLGVVA